MELALFGNLYSPFPPGAQVLVRARLRGERGSEAKAISADLAALDSDLRTLAVLAWTRRRVAMGLLFFPRRNATFAVLVCRSGGRIDESANNKHLPLVGHGRNYLLSSP